MEGRKRIDTHTWRTGATSRPELGKLICESVFNLRFDEAMQKWLRAKEARSPCTPPQTEASSSSSSAIQATPSPGEPVTPTTTLSQTVRPTGNNTPTRMSTVKKRTRQASTETPPSQRKGKQAKLVSAKVEGRFQTSWYDGRPWLRFEMGRGMWCVSVIPSGSILRCKVWGPLPILYVYQLSPTGSRRSSSMTPAVFTCML